ncbi:MAG: type II secretion system protein [Lysobacterales bacterium]
MKSLITGSALRRRGCSKGFTLLEVMLAFVIFALSFAVVLEIMAGSMRSVVRAKDDTEVALLAQSIMDQVGNEIPVEQGEYDGTNMDRYHWNMDISLYDASADSENTGGAGGVSQELADMSGIELYRVDLYVDWDTGKRERNLHFSTIHSVLANRP